MSIGQITPNAPTFQAPLYFNRLQFLGDAAYPTGGTPSFSEMVMTALARGPLGQVVAVITCDCGGYVVSYDPVHDTLKVWQSGIANAPLVEVPAATNLSAILFTVMVFSS